MGTNFFDFREQVTGAEAEARRSAKPLAACRSRAAAGAVADAADGLAAHAQIDRVLRAGFPGAVLVKGEVSNYRPNRSGHALLHAEGRRRVHDCVMWKSDAARLQFTPADGMELLARGDVQVYAQQGKYQLYVTSLQPLGQGRWNWRSGRCGRS